MSLPEIKLALAKLPRRARRQLATHLVRLDRRPKSARRRKTVPKNPLSPNPLVAACLAANKDPALCREIAYWQAFDDSHPHP